jgi:hypothetical protein
VGSPKDLSTIPIVFLDFDGVLHHDHVYRKGQRIYVKDAPGQEIMQHAHALIEALRPYPDVRIVLSTSWVRVLGYTGALKRMPVALRERVIGSTYHRDYHDEWMARSRYEQITAYVKRHRCRQSLAIDNDLDGWPRDERLWLVACSDEFGLGDPTVLEELQVKLAVVAQPMPEDSFAATMSRMENPLLVKLADTLERFYSDKVEFDRFPGPGPTPGQSAEIARAVARADSMGPISRRQRWKSCAYVQALSLAGTPAGSCSPRT